MIFGLARLIIPEIFWKKNGMQDSKPVSTPVDVSSKLEMASSDDVCIDQEQYQSTVGSLMHLSICNRPDISFAVGNIAQYLSKPTHQHWKALK